MAVWLVRVGSHGQHEQKFLKDSKVYATWDDLNVNLENLSQRSDLASEMTQRYLNAKPKAIQNWVSQVWSFAHDMNIGDLVVVPLKSQPGIQIGEITGAYFFNSKASDPYYHSRTVKWIGEAVPRTNFGQDILYTFGAFMTICRVQRNNAEARISAMRLNNWKPESIKSVTNSGVTLSDQESEDTDIEELARDQIAQLISSRFKGHNLTRLVDSVLRAQGYTTYVSPEGADGGADILAGTGSLGFGAPRLCVEVKSGDSPIDRPAVDKLLGAVSKFGANEGLFVSWNGYKSNVQKELASSFFRVRLWTQKELMDAVFTHYDRLDEEIRAELPLKRIWMVATQEE